MDGGRNSRSLHRPTSPCAEGHRRATIRAGQPAYFDGLADILVYVFGDASQDLYHAREPDERGVVMPERIDPFYLTENRRSTKAIHAFAQRFSQTDASDLPSVSLGPDGSPVEVVTYADDDPDACRRAVGAVLREIIDRGRVAPSDCVVLTPRSARSSWLLSSDGSPVEAWPYRLMPEYGPEGAVLPAPTKGGQVRVATIHRYKGLESPCVVLAEIDGRVDPADLASLLYVGATRARSHLVVVAGESVAGRIQG
ncbi:MAG TPA: ATP-binding domain-containing protein, partial [Fimbriimonadaceae bacterium]|nr:ATP-binding domain-containing protein [Fimbriimonadaceae bacterium]